MATHLTLKDSAKGFWQARAGPPQARFHIEMRQNPTIMSVDAWRAALIT